MMHGQTNINFSQLWLQYVSNKNNTHLAAGILLQRLFLKETFLSYGNTVFHHRTMSFSKHNL